MRRLIVLIFFMMSYLLYANEINTSLYPIKKRINGTSVKYEVAFINYNGELVIPFNYSWGSVFENNIGIVEKNEKFFIINSKEDVIKELNNNLYPYEGFSDGLCIVEDLENKKYGFINYDGEIVIPIQYYMVESFHDGEAKVYINKKEFYYINKKNEKINKINKFENDYYLYKDSNNKLYGLKNIKNEVIIPAKYKYLSLPTKYGLCVFSNYDDDPTYGVVNINNEVVYDGNSFYEVNEFVNGMAIFSPRNKFGGYLREDGKVFYYKDYY